MKDFCAIYVGQEDFQRFLIDKGMYGNIGNLIIPEDNQKLFSYHIQAMISELGEVLAADERWKNYRNVKYDSKEKLEEIADCFLTMMNVAIYSGYQSYEVEDAIIRKMGKNKKRVEEEILVEKSREAIKESIKREHEVADSWEMMEADTSNVEYYKEECEACKINLGMKKE